MPATADSTDPVYVLKRLYASEAEAIEAARAKLAALSRGTGALAITLSRATPCLEQRRN
ncbi:MAG: hypothetical protein OXC19_12530 [Bryobacterales bacterium]|nr:hypothetical protein [Bryobacterales bacterium]